MSSSPSLDSGASYALAAFENALAGLPGLGDYVLAAGRKIDDLDKRLLYYQQYGKFAIEQEQTYTEIPVSPEEFLCSPHYLDQEDALWPEVRRHYADLNSGKYDLAVLTGGIGVAKTTIGVFTTLYQLYLLSVMKNPHKRFGLIPTDEIVIIFQSITKTLAKSVDYTRFEQLATKAPYFRDRFPRDMNLKSELHFPKRIIVKPVSGSSTAAIGQNVIGGLIDEVNFMSVVTDSKQAKGAKGGVYDQAEELFNAIARRRESRFMMPGGKFPGMLCLISSKQYPGEFTDRVIARARKEEAETGSTSIFVYDKRRWEVRPDQFKNSKWFKVFVGDETRKPRILEPHDSVAPADQPLVMDVPEEYRRTFEANLLDALRDVGGVSTQALHPFIPATDRIASCFGKVKSVLTRDSCDFIDTKIAIDKSLFRNPHEPRFVHVDLAISNDSAGVAIGYVPKFVEIPRGKDEVETMPVIEFDTLLEIKPPRNDEIPFDKIRELLYKLREAGLNIRWVTYDSFQSQDSLQLLKQRGFTAGLQSMDADLRPYAFLKTAIMDGRVLCPSNPRAQSELSRLEWDAVKKKIDHPPNGSKDIADCMAGVAFGLTMRLEIWVKHKVRARLPKRLVDQAKGGKNAELAEAV